jgi:ketosteroid isomerase-like protein
MNELIRFRLAVLGAIGAIVATSAGCAAKRTGPMTGRELVEIDDAWAKATADNQLDAAMDYWTEDAVCYLPFVPPLYGKDAIREFIDARPNEPGPRIQWSPGCAGIDEGGSMGYTLGEGKMSLGDDAGIRNVAGRYVAIWRRDGNHWRCAVKCWVPQGQPSVHHP